MMKKIALVLFLLILCAFDFPAHAQQSTKVPNIGYLVTGYRDSGRAEAFRQGLRDLGYFEGKNIIIQYRFGEGNTGQIREMARELVDLKVDVILAIGVRAGAAARDSTKTIPIIIYSADPVASGLVASLASPGGNTTGLTNFTQELAGKRVELLKEVVPNLTRVAVLWRTSRGPTAALRMSELEIAARSQRLQLYAAGVQNPSDLEPAFLAMRRDRVGAFVMIREPVIISLFDRIIDLSSRNKLPAMYDDKSIVQNGGLMSYGADLADLDRRAATYVDRILKGAKPADLPVEQPTKFEFAVNLRTASKIGLKIPDDVLRWADDVIR